jgi:hypothetical protein
MRGGLTASAEDEWKSVRAAREDQRPAELTGQHWFAGAGISGSNSRICADFGDDLRGRTNCRLSHRPPHGDAIKSIASIFLNCKWNTGSNGSLDLESQILFVHGP